MMTIRKLFSWMCWHKWEYFKGKTKGHYWESWKVYRICKECARVEVNTGRNEYRKVQEWLKTVIENEMLGIEGKQRMWISFEAV